MSRILLVALCGLPGTGKSALCGVIGSDSGREAIRKTLSASNSQEVRVHHLSFDNALWAELSVCGNSSAPTDIFFSPEAWKESRACVFDTLEAELKRLSASESGATFHLFLLDDNMQLRSMRRRVYQLARSCKDVNLYGVACRGPPLPCADRCGYLTLFVDAPLPTCLARNKTREGLARVSDDVIRRMADALEPPNPAKHNWEQRFIHLWSEDVTSSSHPRWTLRSTRGSETGVSHEEAAAIAGLPSAFWRAIAAAFRNAVPPELPDPEQLAAAKSAAQALNLASLAHQADLALRKLIAAEMQSATERKEDKAALAARLNEARKQMLAELRREDSELYRSLAGSLEQAVELVIARFRELTSAPSG